MNNSEVSALLQQMGLKQVPNSVSRFQNEEDGSAYDVWKIEMPSEVFVLKQAKGFELETYQTFFTQPNDYAPRLIGCCKTENSVFLLVEYIPGGNLMHCSRGLLTKALDSLVQMQSNFWGSFDFGQSYEKSLSGRKNRRNYLNDPQLEAAYDEYLHEYSVVPRTLCHDDLLPFNIIINDERAVFIDWEYGGILPYPTSLVRMIAHGEEKDDAFFYMKESDKHFAIRYYYDALVSKYSIPYEDYLRSIKLFLFYEYCEWVFVGNKYGETDNDRFRRYLKKAKEMARELGY